MRKLYQEFREKGYDFIVGVPCSRLKDFIEELIEDPEIEYIPCTREDEALAMCVVPSLIGKKPLCYMQNSGLGNCVDIITSLLKPYGISVHLLISVRKQPKHHELMGRITEDLLELMDYQGYTLIWGENEKHENMDLKKER